MSLPINRVLCGDCAEITKTWPANSIDCVVTDPPYGISFMGKSWDKALPPKSAFEQAIRVLKPGALAFVMSSPRQDVLWRMLVMLEGVGFELRQSFVSWIYKTGFPKAFDVSKGIDRKFGLNPKKIRELPSSRKRRDNVLGEMFGAQTYETEPVSKEAKKWEGWKSLSGLKPALECVLMVNKPRSERTIVDNVLRWGTGAMNVDACRIPFQSQEDEKQRMKNDMGSRPNKGQDYGRMGRGYDSGHGSPLPSFSQRGRFPANLLVSDGALDTGETTKSNIRLSEDKDIPRNTWSLGRTGTTPRGFNDEGSPFRYFDLDAWARHRGFLDVAKPSKAERDRGLIDQPLHVPKSKFNLCDGSKDMRFDGVIPKKRRNVHPTVKPIKLMAYLIELGCPPSGIVVDPFLGSGTTCIAAKKLRRKWIGIEINPEYAEIAEARINVRGPLDQLTEPTGVAAR